MLTKDLHKRGIDKFKDKHHYSWLGDKLHTIGFGNWLWIFRFKNGAKIRKKYEDTIILENRDLALIANEFKDLAGLHSNYDLDTVAYKFPNTQEFIEQIKKGKISFGEMEKIRERHKAKLKIVEALEKGNGY
jgi:hypothetical protein